jgi:hypothetical protein
MTAALPASLPRLSRVAEAPPAAVDPTTSWRVAVTGTGPMQMLVADALLVRVSLLDPELPALHSIHDGVPLSGTPPAEVLRRVLSDSRVEISPDNGDADLVVHTGTALPGAPPCGVATTRQLRRCIDRGGWDSSGLARQLRSASSAVVAGSVGAAVSLLRAARTSAAPRLRDVHLVLRDAALHPRSAAAALAELLDLDVNVLLDPAEVPLGHQGSACPGCCLPRSIAALAELAERFEPSGGGWLHITFRAEPVQLIGRDRVEGVVMATMPPGAVEPELATVSAEFFVPGKVAVAAGLRLLPAAVPGAYVAIGTGKEAAHRVVDSLVLDAVRQKVVRRPRSEIRPGLADRANVVALPVRQPSRQRAGGSS